MWTNKPTPCQPVRRPTKYQGCRLTLDVPSGRPELAIYSQQETVQRGEQPTWDNPDIDTYHGSTENEVLILDPLKARIRNLSEVAPATNALVHCDIGPFGIGTPLSRISTQVVTILPEQQEEVIFPLPQAVLDGDEHLTVRITTEVSNDLNRINNLGEQSVAGGYSSVLGRSPVFTFPVVNRTGAAGEFSLFVLDNPLSAEVTPGILSLAAMQESQVELHCQIPEVLHRPPPETPQRLEVTVVCRSEDGRLYGGVSCFVIVDN